MKPVVVFLHAFPLDARMWSRQLAGLPLGWHGIAPDLPGFRGSPLGAPSVESYARAVLDRLSDEGIGRFVATGLSMGGYVAFRLAALAPDRLAGLVLCDTRAAPDDEVARARRTVHAEKVRTEGVGWLADAMGPALLCDDTRRERPEVEKTVREMTRSSPPEGIARALEALRDRPDSTPLLKDLRMPVLAMVGANDGLSTPAEMQSMVASIPGARLVTLPHAGHLSNLESPVAFDTALHGFLQSL